MRRASRISVSPTASIVPPLSRTIRRTYGYTRVGLPRRMASAMPCGRTTTSRARMTEDPSCQARAIGAQDSCWTHKRRGTRSSRPMAASSLAPLWTPYTPMAELTAWTYQSAGRGSCSAASRNTVLRPSRRAGLKNPPSPVTPVRLAYAAASSHASTKDAPRMPKRTTWSDSSYRRRSRKSSAENKYNVAPGRWRTYVASDVELLPVEAAVNWRIPTSRKKERAVMAMRSFVVPVGRTVSSFRYSSVRPSWRPSFVACTSGVGPWLAGSRFAGSSIGRRSKYRSYGLAVSPKRAACRSYSTSIMDPHSQNVVRPWRCSLPQPTQRWRTTFLRAFFAMCPRCPSVLQRRRK